MDRHAGGLTLYRDRKFTTYTKKDGLADTFINSITEDQSGAHLDGGRHLRQSFPEWQVHQLQLRAKGFPIESLRTVYCGRDGSIYVAGFGGVVRLEGNRFVSVIGPSEVGATSSPL